MTCYGPVDGTIPGSYRAECTGTLSLLLYLSLLQRFESLLHFHLPIYIDNIALIHRLHNSQSRIYYSSSEGTHAERDLLIEIEVLLSALRASLIFHHVHGHQDRHTPTSNLSPEARANVCADALATTARGQCHSLPCPLPSPAAVCQLTVHGVSISWQFPQQIQHLYFWQSIRRYITTRYQWPTEHLVDWSAFQSLCQCHSSRL